MDENYEKYLEEKFNVLNSKIDSDREYLIEKISNIDKNRQSDNSYLKELIEKGFENLSKDVSNIKEQNETRIKAVEDGFGAVDSKIDNVDKKVVDFDKKMQDVLFFARHPKLFVVLIVAVVLFSIGSILANNPFNILSKSQDKVETPTEQIDLANENLINEEH
jgi:hypothetical protein